ncbi:hypothetical protein [Mesorhizobium sp. B2-8-9]|uniref:hypothetical protein n=1 Tax=Mesorhizobium sp. B2-8-9 TaxID=2589899 RepID=UPI00112A7AF3|nr:hypothetical protein [Mesorhizobium sp. B2-8-9]TPI76248.1 hypothetical protein FJ423_21465 [Mesorhizobium sp. B2-8-9]
MKEFSIPIGPRLAKELASGRSSERGAPEATSDPSANSRMTQPYLLGALYGSGRLSSFATQRHSRRNRHLAMIESGVFDP